jgi:prepilin-type N-terminal cleavage/methylation domain
MWSARKEPRQHGVTMIELLVVMAIMSVVTTMTIVIWVSLRDSYAYTTTSSKGREYARDTVTRMAREIRDAVDGPNGADAFVLSGCGPNTITFYTTFNKPGASVIGTAPRKVQFLLSDSKLYRKVDSDGDGTLDRTNVLCTDVVNKPGQDDVFSYTVIEPNGAQTPLPTPDDPTAIVSIGISLMIDLNPGKAPVLMDLTTSVQPRNLRQM